MDKSKVSITVTVRFKVTVGIRLCVDVDAGRSIR